MTAVTVAVVNYNGRAHLETLLPSLAGQTFTDFVTHVVDDASTDDAHAYVAQTWPAVRWLAAVVRMDGRRIDLLELTRLGRSSESDAEAGER